VIRIEDFDRFVADNAPPRYLTIGELLALPGDTVIVAARLSSDDDGQDPIRLQASAIQSVLRGLPETTRPADNITGWWVDVDNSAETP
jgi:hypothetical protein